MVRAMTRRSWWWQGVVHLSLVAVVVGQLIWPIQGLWAAVLTWDADTATTGAQDGSGTWNTTNPNWWDGSQNVVWNNTTPDSATFGAGSGAAGTVTVSGNVNVAGITFSAPGSGNYTLSGGTITLTAPSVVVNADATIGSVLAGTVGLSKSGSGTLTLSGTNTFTGGITITGGVLAVSADGNLNGANNAITLDGGTLRNTASAQVNPGTITIGTSGGTIDVVSSKIYLGAGRLAGSGQLTKAGSGILQLAGANTDFSGAVVLNAGNLEVQNTQALGTTPPTIVVNGGDLVMSNLTWSGNVVVNGGRISGDNGNSTYTGMITANAAFEVGLRDFYATGTARNLTLSGSLVGNGDLSTVGPTSGTGTLYLTGNNSSYTGTVRPGANTVVQFNSISALGGASVILNGGTARIYGASSTLQNLGQNGLNAYYYNVGASMTSVDNRFATDLLIIPDRVIQRIDTDPNTFNLPVSINTDYPRVPVVGFQVPDRLAMMWKGLLNITSAGSYTFRVAHDDNFSLYIDGQAVLPDAGWTSSRTGSITLAPGPHSIVIKFTQGTGGKYLVVEYTGTDTGGNYQILGSTPGVLTTGSLAPLPIGQVGGNGTLEIYSDMVASGFTGSGTFTLTSPTISTLTIDGPATLTAATTLAPTTGALIFKQGISGGYALTVAGPYLTRFEATNTYTGSTTVTGGRLELAASGGNAIPGALTINAANTSGLVANVQLKASDQIADSATVTVQNNSLLDLGSYNDTISRLSVQAAGQIWGTGTLTVTDLTGSTFQSGRILANLAGTGTLNKTTTGTLILAGNNTYTGQTAVQAGVLNIRHSNALGATGLGNGTTVSSGATLELQGGLSTNEDITLVGSGHNIGTTGSPIYLGALRNVSGTNTLGQTLTLNGATLIRSEGGNLVLAHANSINALSTSNLTIDGAGEVTLRGTWNLGGGTLTKQGRGTLTFDQSLSTFPSVNWVSGAIGFNGPQSWGTYLVPEGKALKFYSDPSAGVSIQLNNSAVIAGYAADQALLSRIDAANSPSGALLLAVDSANALNFTSHPTLVLGAIGSASAPGGRIRYTGTLTPGAGGYLLGAPTGDPSDVLEVASVLSGSANVGIYGPVILSGTNTFTGTISIDTGGALLSVVNNPQLGAGTNAIVLNGGILQLINTQTGLPDALFGQLGNALADGSRQIQVGPDGGTIDVPSHASLSRRVILSGTTPLTGSGTLTKTGYGYLEIDSSTNFSGHLIVAGQGGGVELRASGALPNVQSITVAQNGYFLVDNQNARSNRQWASVHISNRVPDGVPITLQGGFLYYRARNASGQTAETFGPTTIGEGHSMIRLEPQGQGADVTISNLIRNSAPAGGGTVRLETSTGTFGSTSGNNPRLFFTNINGAAPTTTNLIGGWAFLGNYHWAAYSTDAGVGVKQSTYTDVGATTFTPSASQIINLTTSGTATLTDAPGPENQHQMLALRFGANAGQTLAFTDGNDVLYIGSGGILSDNFNQSRTIGSSTLSGTLTAGAPGATGTQELFFHINQGTTSIYSKITDNSSSAPVALVKDLGGTLEIYSTDNTYSGGTYIYGGRINARTGSLGTGPVVVKASVLQLNNPGVTSSTEGIRVIDGSELYLFSNTAYNQTGDRFYIQAGSTLSGYHTSATAGFASLTRVASLTGPGQVVLEPGAIIRIVGNSVVHGDVMTYMIANLGTDADLYFNQAGAGSPLQSITVGAGTPWKGLSSSVGEGWGQGTIYANSDFWLQGLARSGGNVTLTLGRPNTSDPSTGSYAIINQAGRPINIFVTGQVALSEDTPVQMSGDITFVVTADGYLQPNWANSFGDLERFGSRAKVLVQAGGTLDPANYTPINPYGDPAMYGKQYPLPSPVNTDVVVEAGGRFLINDASGIGSTTGGATWTMKPGSILELGTVNAFYGGYDPANPGQNATGLINPGQFVFEPGAIIRLNAYDVYKLSQFVTAEPNGDRVIYEIYNGNRRITSQVNPFIAPAVGVVRYAPETIQIGQGGMITNDSVDRRLEEGRGKVILEDGAILAATTQTILYIQEGVHISAGATITIGLPKDTYIDGNPKYGGAVWFDALHGILIDPRATIVVSEGAQLGLANRNVWPDTVGIHLPYPVTDFAPSGAWTGIPGNGSTLMLRTGSFTEVIGPLTGSGGVLTDQSGAWVATGWGATSDFTFAGVFSGTAGQQPNLEKIGPTRMDLTGTSTSTGEMRVNQGVLALSGATGKTAFATVRVGKTGTLLLDNSTDAVNDRLGQKSVAGQGGVIELLGHPTSNVTETLANLYIGGSPSGNKSYLQVRPTGTGITTLLATTIENYVGSGRQTTWVFRGPALANQPIVYKADNTYTVPTGNLTNGLIRATNPNFWISSGVGQPGGTTGIAGAAGTPVVPTRPDLLGDSSYTGQGVGFVTQDINSDGSVGFRLLTNAEYASYFRPGMRTNLNVWLTGSATAWGDTQFRVLRMAPGSELNITGTVPLTASPSQLTLTAPGILVDSGGSAAIRGTYLDSCYTANASLYFHTYGDLNLEASPFTWNSLVKSGPGTLTFAPDTANIWRGTLIVQEGNVILEANNTFRPWPSQHRFYFPTIHLHGGTLDLGDNSQWIGDLQSANWLPYDEAAGGTLTSTSPLTLTMTGGGTFSGQITGPISIVKYGTSTLLLTNENPMSGSLTIRQGVVTLRDEGRLPNLTGPINIEYSRLHIDNAYLAARNDRLPAGIDLVMRNGDFLHYGRAGTVSQVQLGTVTLQAGTNLFQTESAGSGATETYIQNLVRPTGSRAVVMFRHNYGFVGTPGNDTTAIRYLVQNVNGVPTSSALVNNILGGWAIVADEHFATYLPGQGIGALGNTADGFAAYDSTDLSTAGTTANVNDGSSRTISASKTVNALRFNGDVTFTLSSGVTLSIASGGIMSNRGGTHGFSGGSLTSGTDALYVFVNTGTMNMGSSITGDIDLVKFGSGTLSLNAANTYTGATYALPGTSGASNASGTLTLNVSGANGTTTVAIPGDLYIHQTTVTENQPNQINQTATVYLYSHARLNLRDAADVSETLAGLVFRNSSGTSEAVPIVSRGSQRVTSSLNLTAARAIDAVTDNPVSVPAIDQNVGMVNFTGATQGLTQQEIYVAGESPINLIFNAGIGTVPSGGLHKTGPGMLHLGGNVGSTFGNPTTLTDLFFIDEGIVRVDTTGGTASGAVAINNKIGSNLVNTVVQNGAGLLGRNASSNPIYGSIRLENGSFLGTTEGNSIFGQATTTVSSLAQLDVPAGATATIYVRDYYYIYDSARTITINSKLTGSGTIELVGPLRTSTVGVLRLGNNILDDLATPGITTGANDFSGKIVLNPNTRLLAQTTGSATTGNELGSATIVLAGGELYLRDNNSVNYGNNVVLQGPSIINADRYGANSGNAITLGTLTVADGQQILQTPFTGSSFTTANNSYRIAFNSIAGPGTLVKAGHQPLEINGYDASFSGNFVVAGPIGLTVQPSGNLRLNAAINTIQNLTVNGIFSPVGGKTLNVQGVLEVGDNAGQVVNGTGGVSTGSVTGAMSVPSNATVSVNILRNNGIIGATGGSTTLSASQIQGSGLYQTYNQAIQLQAPGGSPVSLSDAPGRATTIKVAGNNTVTLNPASGGAMTGGVEVQSGTLKVAPSTAATNPFGTTTIKVLGYGTPTVASPVAATLQLVGTNPITHGGDIQNSGLVQISGSVTVAGTIAGPGTGAFIPGLLESLGGTWDSSSPQGTGNFGVKLEPRMGNMNVVTQDPITGWGDNHTWVYSGLFYDADGYFSFLENIDDNAYILIDGTSRLSNGGNYISSTAMVATQRDNAIYTTTGTNPYGGTLDFGNPDLDGDPTNGPEGWHTIEIRFNNGGGGAGPWGVANGMHNNFGFGLNVDGTQALDGALYTRPIDPGNGTLFRVPIAAKGRIEVAAGATLTTGAIDQTERLTLTSSTAVLTLTNTGMMSNVDELMATDGTATLNGPAALQVLNSLSSGTTSFTKAGNGALILGPSGTDTYTGSTTVTAGKLLIDGQLTSDVTATGGELGGAGTIQGNVLIRSGAMSTAGNSMLDPTGKLTITGNYTQEEDGIVQIDIQGSDQGTTYDWIAVSGTANLDGRLRIVLDGYQPASLETFDVLTASTIMETSPPLLIDDALAPLLPAQYWTYQILGNPGEGMILQLQVGVPEPSSVVLAALAGLALLGWGLVRRRKR